MCGSLVDEWSCGKHSVARFRPTWGKNLAQITKSSLGPYGVLDLFGIQMLNKKHYLFKSYHTGSKRSQRAWYMSVYLSLRVMKHQLTRQQIEPSWGTTGIIDWTLNCWVLMHTCVSPQRIVRMFLAEDGHTQGTWSDHGLCSMHLLWLIAVSCWNWGMNKLIVNHLGRHFVAWS